MNTSGWCHEPAAPRPPWIRVIENRPAPHKMAVYQHVR